jgi:serine phosphatase RsbU (regulator of sigma subunit)
MRKHHSLLIVLSFFVSSYSSAGVPDSLLGEWGKDEAQAKRNFNRLKSIVFNKYMFVKTDSAVLYSNVLLRQAYQAKDDSLIADAMNTLGVAKSMQGDYTLGIQMFTDALKIHEKLNDTIGQAVDYMRIALIHKNLKDTASFFKNVERAKSLYFEVGSKRGLPGVYQNLSDVNLLYNRPGVALKNIRLFRKYSLEIGPEYGIDSYNNLLGRYYMQVDQLDSAELLIKKALEYRKEQNQIKAVSYSANNLAEVYLLKKDYLNAIKYSKEALSYAQKAHLLPEEVKAYKTSYLSNKNMNRYKESLTYFEKYFELKDSLESEENQKEVIRQEYKYQYDKRAALDSIENAKQQKIAKETIAREKAENERKETIQYALFGGLALVLIFAVFMFNRFRITRKQKRVIEYQKEQVDEAFNELELKNSEILDSINYAKRIQTAILPPRKLVKEYIPASFILYKPKDIVAGDFYWMEHIEDRVLFAAADCTGHGVPGAMVSVVCNNGLNRSVREYGLTEPAKILDKTREIVIQEFEKSEDEVKDGMDIALCSLKGNQLEYAGAQNSLWIIRHGKDVIEEIKADKQPIGKFGTEKPFTNHKLEMQKGDAIYIFSDGFADQFGGVKGKKFMSKNFKKLLLSIVKEPMDKQRDLIDQAFEEWKGSVEQLDDVCVLGVRI